MFSSCCCVSKKALKKAKDEQTKVSEKESELGNEVDTVDDGTIKPPKCDNNNSQKSPQPSVKADTATDAGKVSEKGQNGGEDGYNTNNDKSNSSEEDSAILSGLIMSDGLVEEIDIQLKNRLVRKKSTDTTSGGSNVTVIEGVVQDEIVEAAKNTSGSDISDTVSAKNSSIEISKEIGVVFNYEPIQEIPIELKHNEVYSEPEVNSEQEVESITQEEFNPPEIELETDDSEIVKEIVLENIEKFTTNEIIKDLSIEPKEAAKEEEIIEVQLQEVVEVQPDYVEEEIPDPIVEYSNVDQIDVEDFPKEIPEPIVDEVVEILTEVIPETVVEEIVEEEPKSIVEEISEVNVEEITEIVVEEITEVTVEEISEVVVEDSQEPIEEIIPEPLIEAPEHIEEVITESIEEVIPESNEEVIPEPLIEAPEVVEETPETVEDVTTETVEEVATETVEVSTTESLNEELEVETIAKLIIEEIQEILTKKESPEPEQQYNEQKTDLEKSIEILEEDLNKPLPSCLSRRNSSRSSIKKKVNYTETTEVIPEQVYFINEDDLHHESPKDDDDDVFSDSIEPILPRGNMCTPYIPKRGSIPGLEALPDWFPNSENGGQGQNGWSEPPTTPIGKDELALKRHRYFTELLDAAQAAIDQRVCSDPKGPINPIIADILNPPQHIPPTNTCEPESNQPAAADLCNLLGRLETIVTRLERSVSERDLDPELVTSITSITSSTPTVACAYSQTDLTELKEDDKNLPTVLPHIEQRLERLQQEQKQQQQQQQKTKKQEFFAVLEDNHEKKMSVAAYEDIISGSLAQFLELSEKIGDDVATQAEYVKKAFEAQLKYVTLASQSSAPDQSEVPKMLSSTSDQITAIITFREKHRTSKMFNHLSAISESIPALGWVCVTPTPGPHVKEMNDAGQFYTNRVLKEWKEKDVKHCNWAKAWVQTLTELQQYIKQYHTTGIVWSGKTKATAGALNGNSGSAAPPPPPPCNLPPPPPMPAFDPSVNAPGDDDRNALFAQINQGADITKKLKKVTSDMQTHKNTALREGPAPYKGPTPFKKAPEAVKVVAPVEKEPVFSRDGKKWLIEYQKNNPNLLVENVEMNNVVYMFKSQNSTLTVKGKLNSIVIDSCKKCSIVFDSLVSSVEFVNCQSVQMQVLGYVPTISIDKTDGCQMFLSKESFNVEIVSSKSSEMNVMLPNAAGDDYTEQAIPEQFKTKIAGNALKTECVESLG